MKVSIFHKPYRSAKIRAKECEFDSGEVFVHSTLGEIVLDEEGFFHARVPNKLHTEFSLHTRAYVEGREVRASVPVPNGRGIKANVDTKYGWFEVTARKTSRSLAWVSIFVEK